MPGVIKFGFNATGTMLPISKDDDSSGIIGDEIKDDWPTIREHSDDGTASSVYEVGMIKKLVLDGPVGGYTFDQYECFATILGFDHNADLEGTNRIHWCIGYSSGQNINRFIALCHTNYGEIYRESEGGFVMNTTNTDYGGWQGSYMRNTICADFIYCLPVELRMYIKDVTKYTDNGSYTSNSITATTDYIFLLSSYEIGGGTAYICEEEPKYQEQYEFFKTYSKQIFNNLTIHNSSGEYCRAWLRSPMRGVDRYYDQCFCDVNKYSTQGLYTYANASEGLIPCFCV